MSISIRLDPATETVLRQRLRDQDTPLSEFVREAIREKLGHSDTAKSPYELGRAVFGRHGSGETDRSLRRKQIVKKAIDAKHRRR